MESQMRFQSMSWNRKEIKSFLLPGIIQRNFCLTIGRSLGRPTIISCPVPCDNTGCLTINAQPSPSPQSLVDKGAASTQGLQYASCATDKEVDMKLRKKMVHLIHRISPVKLNLQCWAIKEKPAMLSVPLNALERQLEFFTTRISGDPLWVAYKESYIS